MKQAKSHITSILVTLLLLVSFQSIGQKSYAVSSVNNKTPEINETIQVTYTLNYNGKQSRNGNINIEAQEFEGFEVGRTNQSQSFSSTVMNGKVTRIVKFNITALLKPTQLGELTIPGLTLTYLGEKYPTEPIKIKVVKEYKDNSINKEIELRFVANKSSSYIGESVRYDLYEYRSVGVYDIKIQVPEIDGFLVKQLESKDRGKQKKINGIRYQITKLTSFNLTPTKSGRIKIPPIKVNYYYRTYGGFESKELKSPSSYFQVNNLPSGAPKNFKGLVGEFSLTQKTDKKKLPVNDAVTTKIKIKGSGNLASIEDFLLDQPTSFEVLPSTNTEKISAGPFGYSGWKNFEFVSIPRQPGRFTIPPIEIPFFNTKTKKYETLKSKPIHVNVTGVGNTDVAIHSPNLSNTEKENVQLRGSDIRYIKSIGELQSSSNEKSYFAGSTLYYLLSGIGILGVLVSLFVFRERVFSNSEKNSHRKNKANKKASKFLKEAKQELNKDSSKFYEAVDFAISEYLLDKLTLERTQLNKSTITKVLEEKNIEESLIKEINSVSDLCKMARYSPIGTSKQELFNKAESIINELESKIK